MILKIPRIPLHHIQGFGFTEMTHHWIPDQVGNDKKRWEGQGKNRVQRSGDMVEGQEKMQSAKWKEQGLGDRVEGQEKMQSAKKTEVRG